MSRIGHDASAGSLRVNRCGEELRRRCEDAVRVFQDLLLMYRVLIPDDVVAEGHPGAGARVSGQREGGVEWAP